MLAGTAEKNRFLNALVPMTRSLFESRMTSHGGGIGDVLQPPDAAIDAVWFPMSGIVSTLRPLEGDTNVEIDVTGAEGFLGIELVLGARRTPDTWIVQSPGRFARLDAQVFLDTLERDPGLREAGRRYLAASRAIRGQWVACNARHTIEQRLAKWLLSARDRVGDEIGLHLPLAFGRIEPRMLQPQRRAEDLRDRDHLHHGTRVQGAAQARGFIDHAVIDRLSGRGDQDRGG